MLKLKTLLFLLFLSLSHVVMPQSYRGLSIVDDNTAWISGSKGTVIRTTNGGQSWDTLNPKGYERKDFRDIFAWNANEAIIMSAGDSARILKTKDAGKTWKEVLAVNRPGVFFDAMDFDWSDGVIVGDPYKDEQEGKWYFDIYTTLDYGETWQKETKIEALENEALFAASGTNILLRGSVKLPFKDRIMMVTGNAKQNRFLADNRIFIIPLKQGIACGIYSFCKWNDLHFFVGGSYLKTDNGDSCAAVFDAKSGKIELSNTQPAGYRSCVAANDKGILISTGTNGTDISTDKGVNWKPTAIKGYNACAFSKNYLWLAGDKGRVLRISIAEIEK